MSQVKKDNRTVTPMPRDGAYFMFFNVPRDLSAKFCTAVHTNTTDWWTDLYSNELAAGRRQL